LARNDRSNSSKYAINADAEFIFYYQCNDGTTVKFVDYMAANGESFKYVEFRDRYGALSESRFTRYAMGSNSPIELADSVTP
jgi:hypothetical protein